MKKTAKTVGKAVLILIVGLIVGHLIGGRKKEGH